MLYFFYWLAVDGEIIITSVSAEDNYFSFVSVDLKLPTCAIVSYNIQGTLQVFFYHLIQ